MSVALELSALFGVRNETTGANGKPERTMDGEYERYPNFKGFLESWLLSLKKEIVEELGLLEIGLGNHEI